MGQLLQHSFDETGAIRTTAFDRYIADTQKTEAMVLKQTRLWAEEQAADRKKQAGRGGGGPSGGGGQHTKP